MFQSLIGFKINWNVVVMSLIFKKYKFQSLIGFKINWNIPLAFDLVPQFLVSIPNRV